VHTSLISELFGICVRVPVFYPFPASFNPALAAPYEIIFVDGGMPSDATDHHSPEMAGASLMIWNMAVVFFYQQQLEAIRARYGRKPEDIENNWPEIARFAWALRNAASHHRAALNFTSNVRPVKWHHLQYDHRDNGKRIIGEAMRPADVFIFLVEFSDELDRLGIPLPD
jgi:hypothetical protein